MVINYVGQVKDGKFNGKGILTYKTGAKYQGEFINGKRHGEGTITQLNGNRFEGNFINDMRHGKGTLSWVSGSSIETEWDLGKRVFLQKSYTWTGSVKNYKMNGFGIHTDTSGSNYEGYYKNGFKHGYGIFIITMVISMKETGLITLQQVKAFLFMQMERSMKVNS